ESNSVKATSRDSWPATAWMYSPGRTAAMRSTDSPTQAGAGGGEPWGGPWSVDAVFSPRQPRPQSRSGRRTAKRPIGRKDLKDSKDAACSALLACHPHDARLQNPARAVHQLHPAAVGPQPVGEVEGQGEVLIQLQTAVGRHLLAGRGIAEHEAVVREPLDG